MSVGRGSGKRPNRRCSLLHGPVHHNACAALGTDKRFDCRESRKRVQCAAMHAASATNLSRCYLHHDSGGEFHGHSPDDGTASVAGYVSLIAAHLDNEAAAAIRSCSHLVGDDGKALFIAGHVLIISRSAGHTRLPTLHRNRGLRERAGRWPRGSISLRCEPMFPPGDIIDPAWLAASAREGSLLPTREPAWPGFPMNFRF